MSLLDIWEEEFDQAFIQKQIKDMPIERNIAQEVEDYKNYCALNIVPNQE